MKKLLLTFLPLLLVVLGGFTASAQDFSVTVTWTVPGSIEVIKGSNPTMSSAVKQTLAPGQTSFTVTDTDVAYWFKPTEGYTLEDASYNERNKSSILKLGTDTYYKLDPTYSKWKALNGLTISLTTGLVEYDGDFTLDIANGADMVSLTMYDANGDATRTLTPQDGKTTVPLIKGETTMWVKTSTYMAIHEVKVGNEVITWTSFRYTVPITKGCVVYIAGTDPASVATKYNITFKFTNNNPGCVKSVCNWTANKLVEDYAAGFEVVSGTILQVNKEDNGDYIFNSFTANGKEAKFNEKITIEENTEFVIDATTKVYPSLSATVYVTDIDGVSFTNSVHDTSAKDITVTKVADKAANTVTLGGYTVKVPTTEYTLDNISGKTRNVFLDIKDGYWLKEGVYGHPEDPDNIYLAGASAFSVDRAPMYLNIGKINFDTPVKIYYQGPANTARLRAKYSGGGDVSTVTYDGATANGTLAQGWSEIKIDPEYDSFFELSMPKEGSTAKYERFACLDGTVLVPNSDEGEAPGVYQNIVFKDNSIIYVFFQEETPKAHTITLPQAMPTQASLTAVSPLPICRSQSSVMAIWSIPSPPRPVLKCWSTERK